MSREPFEAMPDVMDAKQLAEALQVFLNPQNLFLEAFQCIVFKKYTEPFNAGEYDVHFFLVHIVPLLIVVSLLGST